MKKYRSDEEWHALFGEQEQSGVSVRQFCLNKDICTNVFYRKKKIISTERSLVRLPAGIRPIAPIEIKVGDMTIVAVDGFSEQSLLRVLRCVRGVSDA